MEIIIAILLVFVVGIVGLWIIGTLYGEEEKDKEEGTGYIPEAMLYVPVLDKEKGTGYIGKEQGKGEMVEFITVVNSARVLKGAKSFDDDTVRAISTLRDKGDSSAIPALEKLLTKVQKKVEQEGMVREYIDNGIAAGYISTEDDIYHIESAIREIKERET